MVASINLGSVVTTGGTAKSTGLASGLDSDALIDDILSARQSSIDGLQDDIDVNTGKITALDEMYLLLDRFKSSLNLLRDAPGINNEGDFVFNYRTAEVTSNGSKDGSSYVEVTAEPGASVGEYDISNVTLAEKHTLVLSGFGSSTASVVTGAAQTPAERFGFSANETVSGSALDATEPLKFYAGYDGSTGTSEATVALQFANNNFEAADVFTVGDTTVTFGTDVTAGASTEETLQNLANYLNSVTTGPESGYRYTVSGGDTLNITRNVPGSNDEAGTDLSITTDFSGGADTTQTVTIGGGAATNGAQTDTLNNAGTDGSLYTQASDANTTLTDTLAGGLSNLTAVYTAGAAVGTTDFTPNSVVFTVEVGGETYTSQPINLGNGSLDTDSNIAGDLGNGTDGFGNLIPAGTEIIFTKDTDSDGDGATTDASFSLKTGDAATIDDQTGADAFVTSIETHLSDNNILIGQDLDSTDDTNALITTSPVVSLTEGTFNLGGVDITLEEGDSLLSIKSKLNAVSDTTGVQAEILKIGEGNFTLQLQSTDTGADNKIGEYGDGEAGDPTAGTLVFGGGEVAFTETQAASDASFTFNGIAVTRDSNVVEDIVDGITFRLKSETAVSEPGTSVTIAIEPDTDVIYDGIVDVLNNYNDLKFFISEQTETDEEGNFTEDAALGGESVLSDILLQVNNEITATVQGLSGAFTGIFNIGIDFTDFAGDGDLLPTDDIFTLEGNTLRAALQSDFDAVKNIFAFDLTSDSTELSVFKRTNDLELTNFKLDIDETRDDGEKVRVLDTDDNFLFYADYTQQKDRFGNVIAAGGTISGKSGTSLAGLQLIYSGDGSDTITVSTTQGVADRLFNYFDNALDEEDGLLAQLIGDFQADNEDLQEDIDDDTESLENERILLIQKFARLEAAIAKANNILSLFNAQETEQRSRG